MDSPEGSAEEERLKFLATLVSEYERRHHPIPPPDPIDYLLHVMEARGLTRKDLEPLIGGRGRVTEILNRRRPLTLPMMRRLAQHLDLAPDVLMQPYELSQPTPAPKIHKRTLARIAAG